MIQIAEKPRATVNLRYSVRPQKRHGVPLLFRNKANRSQVMVKWVSSNTWNNEECATELRQKWLVHLTGILSREEQIYVSHIDKKNWRTLSKRVLRANGESAIIEQAGEYLVVFTNAPVGEPVSKAIALSMLERAIASAESPTKKRPVHTSRGWGLPKTSTPKTSQWERVSKLSVSVEEARKIVESVGLEPSSFFGDFASGFVLTLPTSDNSDKAFERMKELLTRGQPSAGEPR